MDEAEDGTVAKKDSKNKAKFTELAEELGKIKTIPMDHTALTR
jgi:hypothetical protein